MRKKRNMLVAGILCVSMIATMFWMDMSKADDAPNYSYIQDYTLGYDEDQGIMVYTGGVSSEPIEKVEGARVYDYQDDNPFAPEDEQSWDVKDLRLTQPVQYTTSDGKVHNIESMLTNFNFIADPTSIDNSDVDGKLYVYGTTEAIEYKNGGYMSENAYNNESLTILSTSDMVNWTDEGCMYSQNLTNEPSYSTDKVKVGFGKKAWAPSGLKIDGDGDGDDEYYIFYTDGGGAVAYVQGESPTGPWKDDLGKVLFTRNTANCSGVVWCFDPAVLVDDKGDAYVYFGGGMYSDTQYGSMSDYDRYENAKTGRVCKIKFEEGTGAVSMDGVPQELETYYFYEDSEINQFDGLYYYSYCTNDKMSEDDKWIGKREIAVYISSDPMNIAFQPTTENGDQYTDEDGVYHNYLGAVLDNPSTLYGEYYNNHHRMLSFKGHNYIIYHSTALNNAIYRASNKYRSLHVDEIKIDTKKEEISITPTYDGASQIENFNPFYEFDGSKKHINATTSSYSAGVKSRRSDSQLSMVLDEINTGDWVKIQGVDFGEKGTNRIEAFVASETTQGAIEVFIDDPTKYDNMVASIPVYETGEDEFSMMGSDVNQYVTGVHDVYFVFRGNSFDVAWWDFQESPVAPPTATPVPSAIPSKAPAVQPTSVATEAPVANSTADPASTTHKVGKFNYRITNTTKKTVQLMSTVKKTEKKLTVPATVKIGGATYKVDKIAPSAFKGNKKLTSITIGKNVTSIGQKAFMQCSSLKNIIVKTSTLKSVGKNALKNVKKNVTIKAPSKKVAAYKRLFGSKGLKSYKVK